jgi:hypothetical protein
MRVMSVSGLGEMYVAPSRQGFSIVSTVGFAGTVPAGLSDSNPVVGGTVVRGDGRLVLLGLASDSVAAVIIRAQSQEYQATRVGNGIWWIAPVGIVDPDQLSVFARLQDGRLVRAF